MKSLKPLRWPPNSICLLQEVKYVRALYDHVSPDPSLLNFKKGDVIKIVRKDDLKEGWVFGIFNNHGGYFPDDYVTHIQEVECVIFYPFKLQ